MDLIMRVRCMSAAAIFLHVLPLLNAAPVDVSPGAELKSDSPNLQNQIDGIPRDVLPDIFLDIASNVERLHLRTLFQREVSRKVGEEIESVLSRKVDVQAETNTEKRVKRDDVDLSMLCPDQSCIGLLKQYEQWRKEHGYAYYTGVWKVGK